MSNFTLNGVAIDDPNAFTPSRQRIETAERTADGSLVVDVIAVKMTFELYYPVRTGTQLATFLTHYDAGTFIPFTYTEAGTAQSKTVRVSNITHALIYYCDSTEYWQDVRITLMEQ
jgi:hypothetical protein